MNRDYDMRPSPYSDSVSIPLTIDVRNTHPTFKRPTLYLILLLYLIWLLGTICLIVLAEEPEWKFLAPLVVFILLTAASRTIIIPERYFKKRREELVANDFMFPYALFWNIYDISDTTPTVFTFASGVKGVFVEFDKDIVIGKEDNAMYLHHEAVSEALLQMSKRGFDAVHIDYMDKVGRDKRLEELFKTMQDVDNDGLRKLMITMLDGVQEDMNRAFASYDAYLFLFRGDPVLFFDELNGVLAEFKRANYVRYRFLNKQGVHDLVESVYGIKNFSVANATDSVFQRTGLSIKKFLTPIWVEDADGNRVVLNKTREEISRERAILEAEAQARAVSKKRNRGRSGENSGTEEDVDIFQ